MIRRIKDAAIKFGATPSKGNLSARYPKGIF